MSGVYDQFEIYMSCDELRSRRNLVLGICDFFDYTADL